MPAFRRQQHLLTWTAVMAVLAQPLALCAEPEATPVTQPAAEPTDDAETPDSNDSRDAAEASSTQDTTEASGVERPPERETEPLSPALPPGATSAPPPPQESRPGAWIPEKTPTANASDDAARVLRRSIANLKLEIAAARRRAGDIRNRRRIIDGLLRRTPVQMAQRRLSAVDIDQRLDLVAAANAQFNAALDRALRRRAEIRHARQQAVASGDTGAPSAPPRLARERDALIDSLDHVLADTAVTAFAAIESTGRLGAMLDAARTRLEWVELTYRGRFPFSGSWWEDVRTTVALLKAPEEGTEDATQAIHLDTWARHAPGCVGSLLAGMLLLWLGLRRVRDRRPLPNIVHSQPDWWETVAAPVALHALVAVTAWVVVVGLGQLWIRSPYWLALTLCVGLQCGLIYTFVSLKPWLALARPGGESAAPLADTLTRCLGVAVMLGVVSAVLRVIGPTPSSILGLIELVVGVVVWLLLFRCWRRQYASRPASTSPERTILGLTLVAATVLVVLQFVGYRNLARFLVCSALSTGAVLILAACVHGWLRAWSQSVELTDQSEDTMAWERLLRDLSEEALERLPLLGAAATLCLLAPALNLRAWHARRLYALMRQPLFTVKGSTFSLYSAALSILVMLAGYWLARWLRERLQASQWLRHRYDRSLAYAMASIVYYVVLVTGVITGLVIAGVNLSVLTVFSATLGIAVGFGSQDIAKNFISGLILILDRSVGVGDYVETGPHKGIITGISIRTTTIRTLDNRHVVIPNGALVAQQVVAASGSDRRLRLLLDFVVPGQPDVEDTLALLLRVAGETEGVLDTPPPEAWVTAKTAAATTFQLAAWTEHPERQVEIEGRTRSSVWRAILAATEDST